MPDAARPGSWSRPHARGRGDGAGLPVPLVPSGRAVRQVRADAADGGYADAAGMPLRLDARR